jgi:hypothetical protein
MSYGIELGSILVHKDHVYRLSKSKLLSALQCPKRLYLEVHQPRLAQVDAEFFQNGRDVSAAT